MLQLPSQLVGRRRINLVRSEVTVDRLLDGNGLGASEGDGVAAAKCRNLVDPVVDPFASSALRLEASLEAALAALVVPTHGPTRAALND